LMNVVVKAVVNFLACHLYQNGDWLLFFFLLYRFSFACTAKLMLEWDRCLPKLLGGKQPSPKSNSFVKKPAR